MIPIKLVEILVDLIPIKLIAIKKSDVSKKIYFTIPYHHQKHGSGLESSNVKIVMVLQLILPLNYIISYLGWAPSQKSRTYVNPNLQTIQKQNNENELYKSPRAVELNVNN